MHRRVDELACTARCRGPSMSCMSCMAAACVHGWRVCAWRMCMHACADVEAGGETTLPLAEPLDAAAQALEAPSKCAAEWGISVKPRCAHARARAPAHAHTHMPCDGSASCGACGTRATCRGASACTVVHRGRGRSATSAGVPPPKAQPRSHAAHVHLLCAVCCGGRRKGDALLFFDMDIMGGVGDRHALHASCPTLKVRTYVGPLMGARGGRGRWGPKGGWGAFAYGGVQGSAVC